MTLRRPRRRALLLATAIVLTASIGSTFGGASPRPAAAAAAHPRLLFSSTDVPAMQQKVKGGVAAAAWAALLTKVNAFTNPNDPFYMDPAKVATSYNSQNQMPAALADLGFASLISGDPSYGRHAIDLMIALSNAGWPVWSSNELGKGDMLKGLGLAFDWTYNLMTPAEQSQLVTSIGTTYHDYFFGILTATGNTANAGSNWMGVSAGGAGTMLLALQGETGAPSDLSTLLSDAANRVSSYWADFDTNGAGPEGYTYAGYGLHNSVVFATAYKRAGLGDLITGSHIQQVVHWAPYELIPGLRYGMVPLNDSNQDSGQDELPEELFAVNPGDATVRWFWEQTNGPAGNDRYNTLRNSAWAGAHNCAFPTQDPVVITVFCADTNAEALNIIWNDVDANGTGSAPDGTLPFSQYFADRGLVEARTGWSQGTSAVVSTFEAHRGPAGHTQQDAGQFTLYGFGNGFAVDSGYGHNYSPCNDPANEVITTVEGGCPTTAGGSAAGHNVILVANQQTTQQYIAANTTSQTITDELPGGDFAYALADTRYQFGLPSPSPWAYRQWLFDAVPGRPVLLAVGDSLEPDGAAHGYDWEMHTDAANAVTVAGPRFTVAGSGGAVLEGLTTSSQNSPTTEPLFVEPFNPIAGSEPQVHTVIKETGLVMHVTFDHLALMALAAPGQQPPVITAPTGVTGGNAIESQWGGLRDLVGAAVQNSPAIDGTDFAVSGSFFKVTEGACETVLRNGTSLTAYGTSFVTVTGTASDVTCGGGVIRATGATGNSYSVYSPTDPTAVYVNGVAVSWTRQGANVVFS